MKRSGKKAISMLLVIGVIICSASPAYGAVSDDVLNSTIKNTAEYLYKAVPDPQVGSIGGEWTVLGLARSKYEVPDEYYQKYYSALEKYVKSMDGKLHDKKYTEYSRVIVALSSIGKDPSNVGGYNLLTALGDYDKTIWQGLNGPVWALIALDSGNYDIPKNSEAETQATRDMYIQRILDCQLPDGGWSLFGGTSAASSGDGVSDPDITGMALQALAKYQDRDDVKKATEEALNCMSEKQDEEGGFSSWGSKNSESCVQMIVALSELGIPIDDSRFVKNGKTMLDDLMTFYREGKGFVHVEDGGGSDLMATEQALYGLVAVQRLRDGEKSLYRMSDSEKVEGSLPETTGGDGLPGKNDAVKSMPVVESGKTFDDITGMDCREAIESLASRGIINGKTENTFEPESTMTRAEFAAIIVQGLGLKPQSNNKFTDVASDDWYAGYVGTASDLGIIAGTPEGVFLPNGTITKQEAAVMVARAAKLCGIDTAVDDRMIKDTLAQFTDYVKAEDWARESLAFCYKENILDQNDIEISPDSLIIRCEIAQMLFNMLDDANLL